MHVQLLQLVFSLLSYVPTAISQEQGEGTVKMACKFLTTAALIQTLFCLTCWLLSLAMGSGLMMLVSVGLWPVLFCDIVIECNKNPDVSRW